MAAATCGSPGVPGPGELSQRRKKGTDSRRRQAALFFLNNISLDGRPMCPPQIWENPEPSPRIPPTNGPRTVLPETPALSTARIVPSLSLTAGGERSRRRHPSQRCSLEGLDDMAEFTPVSRPKLIPESPRNLRKIHFIKSMRQYDTRSSRIVMMCAKRSFCAAFSILPYGESLRISELRVEGTKQRHPSGGASSYTDPTLGMEGVELVAEGEVVSYAKYLYPTNALVSQKDESQGKPGLQEASKRNISNNRFIPVSSGADLVPNQPPDSTEPWKHSAQAQFGSEADSFEYNPDLLDDPQWPCGKHKRVLIFASYMTTVIEYVKPSDLKKDMNEMFKEKFPNVKLTLSKIRSLKREMRNVAQESSMEPVTVAMSYVYFEKLVLQGKVNKQNRKLCAGACVLLAAKISSDFKKPELKHLLDKLEERFRANRRDLVAFELTVLVAMELALYLPEALVLPHFRRLTKQQ